MKALLDMLRTGRVGDYSMARGALPALLALLLPLAALTVLEAGGFLVRLVVVLFVTLFWQALFARLRGRAMGLDGLVTGALIALLVPAGAPVWQLILGASFGVVLGEQVFGGRGRNFVNPAVVALCFLIFSFTGEAYREGPDIPLVTLVPALFVLLVSGQAAWRVLLPAGAVMVLLAWGQGAETPWAVLLDGGVVLALLLLAADPVSSAATDWGRLVYGALVGLLAGLFTQVGAPFGATVFAVLLASIFAPLIDQGVIALHMGWRGRRHG